MSDTAGLTLSITGTSKRDRPERTDAPALIVALECSRPRALSARHTLRGVAAVYLGRGHARTAERRDTGDGVELSIRIPDRWMSSRHAVLERSFGRWILRDTESKNGTLLNGEPTTRAALRDGDLFELGHTLFRFREAIATPPGAPPDLDLLASAPPAPGMATLIPAFAETLDKLAQVARSDIPVLIEGESGTGKEVLARAVHLLSGRDGDIVAVNCGAIPANLVESELFGHRRGAFSGAVENRPGLVRTASGGTLFLDEIGDLPAPSQAALLRVLQERVVTPVGDTRPVPVDLRVVAATHRDLDELVAAGGFRRDLFARLSGFRIALPALADRADDLGLLVGTLHDKITGHASERGRASERERGDNNNSERGSQHPGFEPEAARHLFGYPWPLNIRELEQTLATAAVLAGDAPIGPDHLPDHVRDRCHRGTRAGAPHAPDAASGSRPGLSADDIRRRDDLIARLRAHAGNVSAIARELGKDRKQIQRWLKRYGLRADDYRAD